uniref:Ribonuclease, RNase K a n=1 Tax=Salmo trutta TaxID=8032 RepID=A0A673YT88_SALTR
MVLCLFYGPKLAACGIVVSMWGIIMLVFSSPHSAVLIEDVPFNEEDIQNPPHIIYDLYNQVGYNCFIAAGIYMLVAVLSFCQIKLNKRKEYMVH